MICGRGQRAWEPRFMPVMASCRCHSVHGLPAAAVMDVFCLYQHELQKIFGGRFPRKRAALNQRTTNTPLIPAFSQPGKPISRENLFDPAAAMGAGRLKWRQCGAARATATARPARTPAPRRDARLRWRRHPPRRCRPAVYPQPARWTAAGWPASAAPRT